MTQNQHIVIRENNMIRVENRNEFDLTNYAMIRLSQAIPGMEEWVPKTDLPKWQAIMENQ